jgi:RNA methyltransferase, TrmH family
VRLNPLNEHRLDSLIESPANPRVKSWAQLRDRKHRERSQLFLVEGLLECQRALQAGYTASDFLIPQDCQEPSIIEFSSQHQALIKRLSLRAFQKIAVKSSGEAIVGVFHIPASKPQNQTSRSARPFVMIAEDMEKPGNLGALLRSADAAGVTEVIICGQGVDIYNHNAIRASRGAVFSQQISCHTCESAFETLQNNKIKIAVADPGAAEAYYQCDYRQPIAILVGSEANGVSEFWRSKAHVLISIPMAGVSDSLNASVAGAVLMFEVARQRALDPKSN